MRERKNPLSWFVNSFQEVVPFHLLGNVTLNKRKFANFLLGVT